MQLPEPKHETKPSQDPSPFTSLDWPEAEGALPALKSLKPRTLIHGVPGSAKAFLIAWFYRRLQEAQPWLILTPTRDEALGLQDDLLSWMPDVPILLCPSWEILPQDVETPDPELVGERQRAFFHLLQGEPGILIATLQGALQQTLPAGEWLDQVMVLRKDQDAPLDIKQRLIALGYESVTQVVELGQFAMRGGILDLASPGSPSGPVRLEFFGETLVSVRPLNILNQRSGGNLSEVYVFPAHEVVVKPETSQAMKAALREKVKEESRWAATALELFTQTRAFPGWEWQAVGALPERQCLFNYLPEKSRLLLLEPLALERKFEELMDKLSACERQAEEEKSDLFPARDLFGGMDFVQKALAEGRAFAVGQIAQDMMGEQPDFDFPVQARSLNPYYGKFGSFISDLKGWLGDGNRVVLWCHNRGERERLSELLREEKIDPKGTPSLTLALGEVERGFALDGIGLKVLPDHDLFRRYRGRRHRRVRTVSGGKPLSSLNELSLGDWAVHLDCGICLYRGLTPLAIDGVTRDYAQLEFADNEKIYLPTDQIGLIQRYIGSEGSPVLSKLGGEQWSRTKTKIKKEIEAVARELMALYSTRQALRKKPFSPTAPGRWSSRTPSFTPSRRASTRPSWT